MILYTFCTYFTMLLNIGCQVTQDDTTEVRKKLAELSAGEGGVSSEQLARLEREVQEQEKLLAGYQQENERLYQQMKKLQEVSKTTEQKMFKENDRLTTQVRSLK